MKYLSIIILALVVGCSSPYDDKTPKEGANKSIVYQGGRYDIEEISIDSVQYLVLIPVGGGAQYMMKK